MSFKFTCPHCNQKLEAEDEWIGQQASCPGCGKEITIEKSIDLKIVNDAQNVIEASQTSKEESNADLHSETIENKVKQESSNCEASLGKDSVSEDNSCSTDSEEKEHIPSLKKVLSVVRERFNKLVQDTPKLQKMAFEARERFNKLAQHMSSRQKLLSVAGILAGLVFLLWFTGVLGGGYPRVAFWILTPIIGLVLWICSGKFNKVVISVLCCGIILWGWRVHTHATSVQKLCSEFELCSEFDLIAIQPGTFQTSCMNKKVGDKTLYSITITKKFWLGKYEVTQAQWKKIMSYNPSKFKGNNRPVEKISWEDAKAFCNKLNQSLKNKLPAGYHFDLPTEAQWEYACRAGSTEDYSGGNVDEVAWYDENSGGETHPVGQKKPNAWGLYDVHGNVNEWCRDFGGWLLAGWLAGDIEASVTDPAGPPSGSRHVFRGGCYYYEADKCRFAFRYAFEPHYTSDIIGFRLALVPIQ